MCGDGCWSSAKVTRWRHTMLGFGGGLEMAYENIRSFEDFHKVRET